MSRPAQLCVQCDNYFTHRDDGICYRCNEKREVDKLLETLAPVAPVRFPLEPGTRLPCEGKTELFFGQGRARLEARELCSKCPALVWCLDWATKNDEEGMWGGLTRPERRRRAKLTQDTVTLVA